MAAYIIYMYNVYPCILLTSPREWLEVLTGDGSVCLDTLYDHPLPDPLLLGASISVEQPDYFETHSGDKTTPLIFAIRNYDFGLVKYMLQTGASPNFPDSRGLTPMMHAVQMVSSVSIVIYVFLKCYYLFQN